jgi:hypothetical protein
VPVQEQLRIVVDDLSGPEVAALLADHLVSMHALTPAESVHALDLAALRTPEVTFWSVWALYTRFGFEACGPFADYGEDPFSRFFRLALPGLS